MMDFDTHFALFKKLNHTTDLFRELDHYTLSVEDSIELIYRIQKLMGLIESIALKTKEASNDT